MSASTLDSFVKVARPPPQVVATSQEIRDRASIFVGNAYRASAPAIARCAINHLRRVHSSRPATHEIAAWRCMVLKKGCTGLGGPEDFEVQAGNDDDGEKWGSSKILKVMESEGVIDAVVIVSRWYGGTMLGPARFSHIQTCATEVCRVIKRKDEVDDCISSLTTLDDILADLRAEFAKLSTKDSDASPTPTVANKKREYPTSTDVANISKLRRLITARENSIKSVKALLASTQESESQPVSTQP